MALAAQRPADTEPSWLLGLPPQLFLTRPKSGKEPQLVCRGWKAGVGEAAIPAWQRLVLPGRGKHGGGGGAGIATAPPGQPTHSKGPLSIRQSHVFRHGTARDRPWGPLEGVTRIPATAPSPPPMTPLPTHPRKLCLGAGSARKGVEPPGEPGGQGLADHKGFYVCDDNSW